MDGFTATDSDSELNEQRNVIAHPSRHLVVDHIASLQRRREIAAHEEVIVLKGSILPEISLQLLPLILWQESTRLLLLLSICSQNGPSPAPGYSVSATRAELRSPPTIALRSANVSMTSSMILARRGNTGPVLAWILARCRRSPFRKETDAPATRPDGGPLHGDARLHLSSASGGRSGPSPGPTPLSDPPMSIGLEPLGGYIPSAAILVRWGSTIAPVHEEGDISVQGQRPNSRWAVLAFHRDGNDLNVT